MPQPRCRNITLIVPIVNVYTIQIRDATNPYKYTELQTLQCDSTDMMPYASNSLFYTFFTLVNADNLNGTLARGRRVGLG